MTSKARRVQLPIELNTKPECTPHPSIGIPPPDAFYFRISDVNEYRDIFTRLPLTRQDFPPVDLPTPPPSVLPNEAHPEYRLSTYDHTPVGYLRPTSQHRTLPLPSHYLRSDPPSHDHNAAQILVPHRHAAD
ncbi:uncharacterized protein SCHCODRAFT_02641281 [Schizophyllum commune H4-8]|nr:uncharacterized protein SCHCODRAFT_02641281 [Schizophyllum commune H4-8]KAI5887312.1 hypothetical protein SCHCODRAFT_02641281 [Schizophyllum commune H4-8]